MNGTILSINIQGYTKQKDELVHLINDADPFIVCLN